MSRWSVLAVAGLIAVVSGIAYVRQQNSPPSPQDAARQVRVGCSQAAAAFHRRESNVWVVLRASVIRILPDEYGRYQHQRFIVQCSSGQTILITNDVSVGSRVPVRPGDHVGVRGQYVWNDHGGLVHFTHGGGHSGGWILDNGRVYS